MSKLEQVKHYASKIVGIINRNPKNSTINLPVNKLKDFCKNAIEVFNGIETDSVKKQRKSDNRAVSQQEKEDRHAYVFEFICEYYQEHHEVPKPSLISKELRLHKPHVIGSWNTLVRRKKLVKNGSDVVINRDA